MALSISLTVLVIFLASLYIFKDRVLLLLFNSQKSKHIFIASYIIKTAKAIVVDEVLSLYLAIALNKKFTSSIDDSDAKEVYITFYRAYLINYYSSELVDSIDYDAVATDNIIALLEEKSESTLEYAEGGGEKLTLVQYVLQEFAKDSKIFSKSLTAISSDLIDIIKSQKAS